MYEDTKQKYVRLPGYNEIIIFPCTIEHSMFRDFNPISAGFCYVNAEKQSVNCFGNSISLGLKSNEAEDTKYATRQVFGFDAMIDVM